MVRVALVILVALAALAWLWIDDHKPDDIVLDVADEGTVSEKAPELAVPRPRPTRLLARMPRRIRGVIVEADGTPIPKVRVDYLGPAATGESVRAGVDGRFEVAALPFRKDGDVTLHLHPAAPFLRTRVRIKRDQSDVRVVLKRAVEPHVIRVVDHQGAPVARAHVTLCRSPGLYGVSGQTDERGTVSLRPRRCKHFDIRVNPRDAHLPHVRRGPFPNQAQAPIVVRLPEPAHVAGHLLDAEGQPAGRLLVTVYTANGKQEVWSDPHTGHFRVDRLDPGPCRLAVRRKRNRAEVLGEEVKAPVDDLRLVVAGGVAFGRAIELAEGARIERADWIVGKKVIEIGMDLDSDDDRLWEENLPDVAGTLFVRDDKGRYAVYRDTRLEDVPPQIVLRPGKEISGVIDCSASHAPGIGFRMGDIAIAGWVGKRGDDGTHPFQIVVPADAEGTLEVKWHGKVKRAQAARGGQTGLRVRVPDAR